MVTSWAQPAPNATVHTPIATAPARLVVRAWGGATLDDTPVEPHVTWSQSRHRRSARHGHASELRRSGAAGASRGRHECRGGAPMRRPRRRLRHGASARPRRLPRPTRRSPNAHPRAALPARTKHRRARGRSGGRPDHRLGMGSRPSSDPVRASDVARRALASRTRPARCTAHTDSTLEGAPHASCRSHQPFTTR